MPTSDLYNILPILTVIQRLKPRSVLDVGCGFGKYGVLLREYLDVCHGRLDPSEWQVRLVGNDAFAGYRNPLWEYIYDEIHVGEAQEVVPTLGRFDVILLADIIEHFEKHAAIRMVEICLEQAGAVVISTPERFHEQGAVYGNPHEIHRILWTRADFPRG